MKIFIVAAAAWAAGALLGYFVARLAYKHLRKRLRTLRQERKPPKKKMGTMEGSWFWKRFSWWRTRWPIWWFSGTPDQSLPR